MSRVKKSAAVAAALIAIVGAFEGLRTVAYKDVAGIPTICYGSIGDVKMGDVKTVEECKALFRQELDEHASRMEACLKSPEKLNDKVYISFASLTYNIGSGAFCGGSVARYANAGDLKKACSSILLYNKARVKGRLQVVKGLDVRRKQENKTCLEGL